MHIKRRAALAAATLTIAASGLALGVGLPTPPASLPSPSPAASCEESDPCFDPSRCAEIGNRICGSGADAPTAWQVWERESGASKLKLDPSRPFRVDYLYSAPDYPQTMGTYDLALLGKDNRVYLFRAVYTDKQA